MGETMFTIDKSGTEAQICGIGIAHGDGVQFHEKDAVHGKDVRVWQISAEPGGGFSAVATAAF